MMTRMMIKMMMINKEAPTVDPTMTPTGLPAGNINSKEKVMQHAILFIDLGQVFMLIEVEMAVRQTHNTRWTKPRYISNVLNKLRFNCVMNGIEVYLKPQHQNLKQC